MPVRATTSSWVMSEYGSGAPSDRARRATARSCGCGSTGGMPWMASASSITPWSASRARAASAASLKRSVNPTRGSLRRLCHDAHVNWGPLRARSDHEGEAGDHRLTEVAVAVDAHEPGIGTPAAHQAGEVVTGHGQRDRRVVRQCLDRPGPVGDLDVDAAGQRPDQLE